MRSAARSNKRLGIDMVSYDQLFASESMTEKVRQALDVPRALRNPQRALISFFLPPSPRSDMEPQVDGSAGALRFFFCHFFALFFPRQGTD